jgi:WD40 repeat protein
MKNHTISFFAAIFCTFCIITVLPAQVPQLILPIGHSKMVSSVAYSRDGSFIATCSDDRTVKIWDAESGSLFLTINDFSEMDYPNEISFSPDGKLLLTVCNGIRISLWDPYTGKLVLEASSAGDAGNTDGDAMFAKLFGAEKHALFSPDGKLLLICESDINVWDIQGRKMIRTIKGPEEGIRSFRVSPDSKYILTNSVENAIDIWEISTGRLIRRLSSDPGVSGSGSFTPDGSKILTRSEDEIILWDLISWKMLLRLSTVSGSRHCLSPDGSRLLVDGNLYLQKGKWVESSQMNTDSRSDLMGQIAGLYDVMTGKLLTAFVDSSTIKENLYVGDYLQVTYSAFSRDMKKVITVTDKCRVWDTQKGTLIFSIEGYSDNPTYAAFSPDGSRIFIASAGLCGLYNGNDGSLISPFYPPATRISDDEWFEYQYPLAGFSPDGKKIYMVLDNAQYVHLYDTYSGEMKTSLSGSIIAPSGASFSDDGNTLVTSSITDFFEVKSWDLKNGKLLKHFKENEMVYAIYPGGGESVHTLFTNMIDKVNIKSFNIYTGSLANSIDLRVNPYSKFQFSPDEKILTVVDTNYTAKIFDAKTGAELYILPPPVGDVIFSPDGRYILTTSWENFAKLYDSQSGKLIREFKDREASNEGSLYNTSVLKGYDQSGNEIMGDTMVSRGTITAEFSADGKRLINTGSLWDNTTRIWNVENGRLLNRFEGTDGSVNNDGTKVITWIYIEDTINFDSKTIPVIWNTIDGNQLFRLDPLQWGYSVFSPDGKNIVTSDFGDTIKFWDAITYKLRRKIVPDGELVDIDWKNNRTVLNENSQLVFYNISTGEKLFSLLTMDSTDYLIVTPDNYYMGTENAVKKLSWMIDGQHYPYDKFNLQYNRPDIVLQRLGNSANHE